MTAIAKLTTTVLDCPEPAVLAEFYSALTGLPIARRDGDWWQLESGGGTALAFQEVPDHIPPTWPKGDRPQQFHLDFGVADLDTAEEQAVALGARKHDHQPGTTFRVFLDPAGHPFCLCVD